MLAAAVVSHTSPLKVCSGEHDSTRVRPVPANTMEDAVKQISAAVPRVTVVIVTYESRNVVGATLSSLCEVIDAGLAVTVVVDNNSSDGTADFVDRRFPEVTLVRSTVNSGFGRGCNLGLRYVSTPYVLLLNPDAVIPRRELLTLLDFMDQFDDVGVCGPAVVESTGTLQPAGGLPAPWEFVLAPLPSRFNKVRRRQVIPGEAPRRTDWVCGSAMLLRTAMIEQIGLFDPRFFLYFEETDLCSRALLAGWQIWTVGEAVATHVNAASARQSGNRMIGDVIAEHYYRSRFYYLLKHFGPVVAVSVECGELVSMVGRAVFERLRGRTYPKLQSRLRAPFMELPRDSVQARRPRTRTTDDRVHQTTRASS